MNFKKIVGVVCLSILGLTACSNDVTNTEIENLEETIEYSVDSSIVVTNPDDAINLGNSDATQQVITSKVTNNVDLGDGDDIDIYGEDSIINIDIESSTVADITQPQEEPVSNDANINQGQETLEQTLHEETPLDDIDTNTSMITATNLEDNNPLMEIFVKTAEIPKISKNRGYIEISKEDFFKITKSQYLEFCEDIISPASSQYNYFTIQFEDGTGICYSGCDISSASYGVLDDTGAITNKQGSITIDLSTNDITSDVFFK